MNFFTEGSPEGMGRLRNIPVVKLDGKDCRDRQPWGGCTDPERCECVGKCEYDRRQEEKK